MNTPDVGETTPGSSGVPAESLLDAPVGRRKFIQGAGVAAGGAVLSSVVASPVEAAIPAGASRFVALDTPVRYADEREPASSYPNVTQLSSRKLRVKVAGSVQSGAQHVPANASALAITLTMLTPGGSGSIWVAAYPAGTTRRVSNVNSLPGGDIRANMATVKIGVGGQIEIEKLAPCQILVDVLGYYEPVATPVRAGRFVSVEAVRVRDTREEAVAVLPSRSFTTIDVTAYVPAEAESVVVNLTSDRSPGGGHLSVVPYDVPRNTQPSTSTLNLSVDNDIRAAGAVVSLRTVAGRRVFVVYNAVPTAIILDLFGYFTSEAAAPSEAGLYVPLTPSRIIDTREDYPADPGPKGRLWPGWIAEVQLPSSIRDKAGAVVVNLTSAADRAGSGWLSVIRARIPYPKRLTSNYNWTRPSNGANHVITRVTGHVAGVPAFQVLSSGRSHVICDLAGYYLGTPLLPQIQAPTRELPPANLDWTMHIPRLGVVKRVKGGSESVVDQGHLWHWTNTALLGDPWAIGVFGHRTDAGGPLRYCHLLSPGDEIYVDTDDGRRYTYRYLSRDITDSNPVNILNSVRYYGNRATLSLIACTKGWNLPSNPWIPTSLAYRIIVTFELVGVTE